MSSNTMPRPHNAAQAKSALRALKPDATHGYASRGRLEERHITRVPVIILNLRKQSLPKRPSTYNNKDRNKCVNDL